MGLDENSIYAEYVGLPVDETLARLYAAVKRHVAAVCYNTTGRVDADLVSETTNEIIRKLPTFRQEAKFSTWVHRIALVACYKRLTERNRAPSSIEDISNLTETLSDDTATAAIEDTVRFKELCKDLDTDERELVLLRLYGYTFEEIAAIMGISEVAAKKRWERLSEKLREIEE